ncbi:MAG: DUF166 family protein [Candidatus Hodarchaeota archaeon]
MKILVISDGQYGDRAIEAIKEHNKDTKFTLVEERDIKELIDEYNFDPDVEAAIAEADLIISYIRHPDINFELALFGKPTIYAIYSGRGFTRQLLQENDQIVNPLSMCALQADTGIPVIDEFARTFGLPEYKITIDDERNVFKEVKLKRKSPCGSTERNIKFLIGKEISGKTLNEFAIAIAQDCRESVAYMLSKNDTAETATLNHVGPLLDVLEELKPEMFAPGSVLHDYAEDKRQKMKATLSNMQKNIKGVL